MAIRTELALRLPNSPGALAGVCRVLADERVDILALSLESGGTLRLLVDNEIRADGALREHRYKPTPRSVLVVSAPHAPGGLAPILSLVSGAGVNIEYAYAGGGQAGTVTLVIGVDDAIRAATATGL
jgi:hypothetical protein